MNKMLKIVALAAVALVAGQTLAMTPAEFRAHWSSKLTEVGETPDAAVHPDSELYWAKPGKTPQAKLCCETLDDLTLAIGVLKEKAGVTDKRAPEATGFTPLMIPGYQAGYDYAMVKFEKAYPGIDNSNGELDFLFQIYTRLSSIEEDVAKDPSTAAWKWNRRGGKEFAKITISNSIPL